MTAPWTQPARLLVERLDDGHEALWSLVYAAQVGILHLALRPELDADLSLTQAGMDLGEAVQELEWAHPHLPAVAMAVDLGPAPPGAITDCRTALAVLLAGALELTARLLRDPTREEGQIWRYDVTYKGRHTPPVPPARSHLGSGIP